MKSNSSNSNLIKLRRNTRNEKGQHQNKKIFIVRTSDVNAKKNGNT